MCVLVIHKTLQYAAMSQSGRGFFFFFSYFYFLLLYSFYQNWEWKDDRKHSSASDNLPAARRRKPPDVWLEPLALRSSCSSSPQPFLLLPPSSPDRTVMCNPAAARRRQRATKIISPAEGIQLRTSWPGRRRRSLMPPVITNAGKTLKNFRAYNKLVSLSY